MTTARILADLRNRLAAVGDEPPAVPGSSLVAYVDDSARRQDTIAALSPRTRAALGIGG